MFFRHCRQYRYEQKLARLLWKVDLKTVQLDNKENLVGWAAAEKDIRRKQKVSLSNGHAAVWGIRPGPALFPEPPESANKRKKSSSVSESIEHCHNDPASNI